MGNEWTVDDYIQHTTAVASQVHAQCRYFVAAFVNHLHTRTSQSPIIFDLLLLTARLGLLLWSHVDVNDRTQSTIDGDPRVSFFIRYPSILYSFENSLKSVFKSTHSLNYVLKSFFWVDGMQQILLMPRRLMYVMWLLMQTSERLICMYVVHAELIININ